MALRLPSVLIAALLLALIGFQAIVPAETAERSHGSAFSAQTQEVALARNDEVRVMPQFDPFPPEPLTIAGPGRAASMREAPAPRPRSTGPPASSQSVQLPHPRAPPLA